MTILRRRGKEAWKDLGCRATAAILPPGKSGRPRYRLTITASVDDFSVSLPALPDFDYVDSAVLFLFHLGAPMELVREIAETLRDAGVPYRDTLRRRFLTWGYQVAGYILGMPTSLPTPVYDLKLGRQTRETCLVTLTRNGVVLASVGFQYPAERNEGDLAVYQLASQFHVPHDDTRALCAKLKELIEAAAQYSFKFGNITHEVAIYKNGRELYRLRATKPTDITEIVTLAIQRFHVPAATSTQLFQDASRAANQWQNRLDDEAARAARAAEWAASTFEVEVMAAEGGGHTASIMVNNCARDVEFFDTARPKEQTSEKIVAWLHGNKVPVEKQANLVDTCLTAMYPAPPPSGEPPARNEGEPESRPS